MRRPTLSLILSLAMVALVSCTVSNPPVGHDFTTAVKKPESDSANTSNEQDEDDVFFARQGKKPKLRIADVLDSDTGLSVMGASAAHAISGSLAGRPIILRIKGDYFAAPKRRAADWLIPMPAGVLTQTWIGRPPHRKVLIDGTIPLQPVETATFSPNELTMQVPTSAVLDWYLKGRHTLSVIRGSQSDTVDIRVGTPEPAGRSLGPVIRSVDVIHLDDMRLRGEPSNAEGDDEPNVLQLEGDNFLVDYHRMWATIDGVQCYFHAAQVMEGSPVRMMAYLHLPKAKDFVRRPGQNRLQVATPFGLTFRSF